MDTEERETTYREIAALLQSRRDENDPIVLFLGTRASNLYCNSVLYDWLKGFSLRRFDQLTDIDKLEECYGILKKGFSERDIHTVLHNALKNAEPQEEDYCLIELIKQEFFDIIISTHIDSTIDSILEKYASNIKVFRHMDFTINDGSYFNVRKGKFFKVFGDLDSLKYTTVGKELDLSTNPSLKNHLAALLAKDTLMIGYDPQWDHAIETAFPVSQGKIWYVDEKGPPTRSLISQTVIARQGKYLLGRQGSYKGFIKALYRHLIANNARIIVHTSIPFLFKEPVDLSNSEEQNKARQKTNETKEVVRLQQVPFTTNNLETNKRTKVFISYSHSDSRYLERLLVHLSSFNLSVSNQEKVLEIWHDKLIESGTLWQEEIKKALETTKVAVLLVSADFLGSPFITTKELPFLLKAAKDGGAVILPVVISPCVFKNSILSQFQSINDPSRPITSMNKNGKEKVWVDVATRVNELLPALLEDE